MLQSSVLKTVTLEFTTFEASTIDPITQFPVAGVESTPVQAEGYLQPLKPKGVNQVDTPEGFTLSGAFKFMTDSVLPTVDNVGATRAAQTTIDGRTYYVAIKRDYSEIGLSVDHIKYHLMMKTMTDGSV